MIRMFVPHRNISASNYSEKGLNLLPPVLCALFGLLLIVLLFSHIDSFNVTSVKLVLDAGIHCIAVVRNSETFECRFPKISVMETGDEMFSYEPPYNGEVV